MRQAERSSCRTNPGGSMGRSSPLQRAPRRCKQCQHTKVLRPTEFFGSSFVTPQTQWCERTGPPGPPKESEGNQALTFTSAFAGRIVESDGNGHAKAS